MTKWESRNGVWIEIVHMIDGVIIIIIMVERERGRGLRAHSERLSIHE